MPMDELILLGELDNINVSFRFKGRLVGHIT